MQPDIEPKVPVTPKFIISELKENNEKTKDEIKSLVSDKLYNMKGLENLISEMNEKIEVKQSFMQKNLTNLEEDMTKLLKQVEELHFSSATHVK